MAKQEFNATIQGAERGAYVTIPFSVPEVFGRKGQVRIQALIDGVPYRGSIAPMGGGQHMLIVLKDIRERIGKSVGDTVAVVLEEDTEPRTVEVPDDLARALQSNPQIQSLFDDLSYTHRKEYVRWIMEAKKPETRERRVQKTIEMVAEGKRL